MSKKLISLFFVSLLILCTFTVAEAQQPPSVAAGKGYDSYVVFKGGIYYPEGDLKDLNTGFNGEIAYGYRFHPNFAVELGSGYLQTSKTYRASVDGYSGSLDASV